MYPSEFLGAADLIEKSGGEAKLEIERVEIEDVPDTSGKKKPKPVLYFKGAKKRLPLPKTCAKRIAQLHGTRTEEWIGKTITIFATTCDAFGETVDCVRVR